MIPTEVIGYFTLEGGTSEASPEEFLAFDHGLIWLWYSTIQIQKSTLFRIRFQLPRKLLLIILLQLSLHDPNNRRNLLILAPSQQRVHLLIGIIPSVQINEALQGGILFVIFESILCTVFLTIVCDLGEHEG